MKEEIKEGYKKTEIGVIPEDWEVKRLGEICEKIGDGLHGTPIYNDIGEYYFINGNNLINGKILLTDETKRVDKIEYIKYKKDLNDRTILISLNGTIGNLAYYNFEKIVLGKSCGYITLRSMESKKYVYYALNNQEIRSYFLKALTGTTIKNLSLNALRYTLIPLPPLKEQQKIASILSTVDEHIEQTDKLIEKTKELKKGLMQKLMTKGIGHTEFKKTEIGEIPKEWEVKRLGEICNILDSKRIPLNAQQREKMKGDIPYYGANGILDYINDYIFDEKLILLAEDGGHFENYKNKPIAFLIEGKSWVNNHAHVLQPKIGECIEWIFYNLVHKDITSFVQGGTRSKLNQKDLLRITISYPQNISEQQKIASILSEVDSQIEHYEAKKEKLQTLKKGLMQKLLTGKIRVKVQ